MGDHRLPDHAQPVELLDIYLGGDLQPPPGHCPLGPPRPPEDQTWAVDPAGATRHDAPPWSSDVEPSLLESCSSQGEPRQNTTASPGPPGDSRGLGSPQQNRNSSTQVVFWAGILQAQMCVLDLEEELEKTEGLRAGLKCCLPPAPAELPGHPGLHPSSPVGEDSGEDSSGPEEEEKQAWPREGTPGLSPEWGAEEESVFFDNPLFLESPGSEASASAERFSWGFPDPTTDVNLGPDGPQALEPPLLGGAVAWELGSEPEWGDHGAERSGRNTPPFPVPTYKLHPCCTFEPSTEGALAAPSGQEESQTSLEDGLGPASPTAPKVDETLTWEPECLSSNLASASHPVQPWAPPSPEGWRMEEGPSWRQVPVSQERGEREVGRPQPPAPCTVSPGAWESPACLPEPSCPESESTGPGPSLAASQEGGPQLQCHSSGALPNCMPNASHSLLLDTDGTEPSSLKEVEAGEAADPEEAVRSEDMVSTAEAGGGPPSMPLTSAERLPESPMPQAETPEEGQRPLAGDKLANGVRTDKVAWNLASRLYHLEGFRKSEVAAYLQKNNDFSKAVAEAYLTFFQFGGQSLDHALRGFLQALVLSGETQERERVLYQFSKRFHHCNPGLFPSADSVHTLTCAVMLLNTDLHGQNIGKSMSCQEFITNLRGLQDGGNFSKELLKALYWSIRSEKLEWAVDEEDTARPEKAQPSPPAGKMSSPLLQLAQDPAAPTYKQGILARKMHQDADGKKTPWGKRGWKMFHTLLRGMVLYFLKGDSHGLEGQSLLGQMVDEPVGVHHSLATPATHYTKRPHVFQLRTADCRLYLFQAPTAKEMSSWIARINLAAATHSAPPFPAAVGSQRRFVRPILPMGPAQSSLEEQHRSHENCLDAASDDLLDLQRKLPERRGRGRELEEHRLRKEYLEYEKTRYETYVQLLVARLHCPEGDLALWEEQLGREAAGAREPKPSLKKSHSSPSLHQEEAPTTAKVKRNISERRTYRKIIPKRNRNQL
uniref:PH and SEC7 domain-containing protein 4 n=1 Tax=Oryctolagus cuniculus TaxID=9986 RepID=G1SL87_RABIT